MGLRILQRLKVHNTYIGVSVKSLFSTGTSIDNAYSKEKQTHFGEETVSEQVKLDKVTSVFSNVAPNYDFMNDIMSAGIHRYWKDKFTEYLGQPTMHYKLLDVAGGTGDIAFRFIAQSRNKADVTVYDINENMLNAGRSKAAKLGINSIQWIHGDAENLSFVDESFDAYTIAFGIRNCVHIPKVLSEAYRVLKRGGRFLCLEFSHVPNPLVRWCYDTYSYEVIPVMGQLAAQDWHSYKYLVESIRRFPKQEEFSSMMKSVGFHAVSHTNMSFGVVAIHSGFKL